MVNLCKGFHLLIRNIYRGSSYITEVATGGVLEKMVFLKISRNSQETSVPESLF